MTVHLLLSAGRGPQECTWALARLLRRLEADAARQDVTVDRVETVAGDRPGTYRSVLLRVAGAGAIPPGWSARPARPRTGPAARRAEIVPGPHDRLMTTVRLRGVDALLAEARAGVHRPGPHEARAAQAAGALIVDTRTDVQRQAQGELPGALVIDRTVLEWRLDPASPHRIPEATDYNVQVIVVCRQGYSSSLAAAGLRALGLHRATDLAGGVEAWLAAGLPVNDGPADVRY